MFYLFLVIALFVSFDLDSCLPPELGYSLIIKHFLEIELDIKTDTVPPYQRAVMCRIQHLIPIDVSAPAPPRYFINNTKLSLCITDEYGQVDLRTSGGKSSIGRNPRRLEAEVGYRN